jgi:hypothetical protein
LRAKVAVDGVKVGAKSTGICYAVGDDGLSKLNEVAEGTSSGVSGAIHEWVVKNLQSGCNIKGAV